MKKMITMFLVVFLMGFLIISQGAIAQDEVYTIRLPWLQNVQFAGPIVAVELGIYEELGINVEIRPGGGDVNSIALVAAGADDFGIHDTGSLIFARSEGMPLVATTTVFQKHPGGIFVLEESGIEEPEDFIGRTLGYKEGGPWTLTQAMFAAEGISLDDINLTTVPFDISPLLTGNVDGMTSYAVNEPVAANLQGYETNIILPYDYGIKSASEALFTTESMIENNPEIVQKITEGTLRGWAFAVENPEEAATIVVESNPDLDWEHQIRQLRLQISHILTEESLLNGIGYMSKESWESTQNILLEFGGLNEAIDIESVFTTEFLY